MNLKLPSLLIIVCIGLFACNPKEKPNFNQTIGQWRGTIFMQEKVMPFNFEIDSSATGYSFRIKNGEEIIEVDEVIIDKDSLSLTFPIFDISIKAQLDGDHMKGTYEKHYLEDYVLPFEAQFENTSRFIAPKENSNSANFTGKWDVKFVEDDGKESVAVGIFNQKGDIVTGTFLTPIGDYRYLEGAIVDNQLKLSTFDGNHAFLFYAKFTSDSTLSGDFWSGKTWHESWTATKNPDAALPSALSLTYLKEGYEGIDFSFPDLKGDIITPNDDRFKNKVVLLQIFGTWCPNCMDETLFYNEWYKENKARGVEVLGLAYEQKDDFAYAVGRVERMKSRLNVGYDFVIAGTSDKEEASKTLPMLNHILSFPTTIFLDRKGEIRRIHTGFSGPGTGKYYEQYKEDFIAFTEELIAESE